MPEIEKFVGFWGGIWGGGGGGREREREREERTPHMPWMEEIRRQLNGKVSQVQRHLEKSEERGSKEKRMDSTRNRRHTELLVEKLEPAQKALTRAFTKIKEDNTNIPTWWPTGRTVLLPKTKSLEDEKDYRPITCLNTSYKIMTGVVEKYMREHTMENESWDEGQLGAVERVLGTVDQLIIDRCIMEEVKKYHRNLAVAFYNYKKAYDKVHHDWMLRVYK